MSLVKPYRADFVVNEFRDDGLEESVALRSASESYLMFEGVNLCASEAT